MGSGRVFVVGGGEAQGPGVVVAVPAVAFFVFTVPVVVPAAEAENAADRVDDPADGLADVGDQAAVLVTVVVTAA